jgi:hypothetical protein
VKASRSRLNDRRGEATAVDDELRRETAAELDDANPGMLSGQVVLVEPSRSSLIEIIGWASKALTSRFRDLPTAVTRAARRSSTVAELSAALDIKLSHLDECAVQSQTWRGRWSIDRWQKGSQQRGNGRGDGSPKDKKEWLSIAAFNPINMKRGKCVTTSGF